MSGKIPSCPYTAKRHRAKVGGPNPLRPIALSPIKRNKIAVSSVDPMGETIRRLTPGVAMALGVGIGVAIGSATGNLASWTAIGAAIGVALASFFGRKPRSNPS